jgi:hypothetical protein
MGRVFVPDGSVPWMHSHASNPFGIWLDDHRMRVFFSSRDARQRSHIASLILNLRNGLHVSDISPEPLLAPGAVGTFDDCGCSMGSAIVVDGRLWLYYLGWNLRRPAPWLNAVGLAIGTLEGDTFEKIARAPVLDRSRHDPYSLSYPYVLHDSQGWRMWYGSTLSWGEDGQDMRHAIKCAHSQDGIVWTAGSDTSVGLQVGEIAVVRPQVLSRPGGGYVMWFCRRGLPDAPDYLIGHAESDDGVAWRRKDANARFKLASSDWDSDLACYPFVFTYAGHEYMLYNGNGYGRTGFGIAIRDVRLTDEQA